jgi:hypothetical protein
MELPTAPFYRRWSFLLAGVVGLAVIVALFGLWGFTEAGDPGTTSTVPPTSAAPPTTAPTTSSSIGPTSKPDDVLWESVDSTASAERSKGFRAPQVWRIVWDFDCTNFRKYGGGNFKITGNGAFERIQIQQFGIEASGSQTFNRGGFGHLSVDSVCKRWTVRVLTG